VCALLWAVTADRIVWRKIDLSRAQLNDAVTKLRASVEKVEIPDRTLAKAFDLDMVFPYGWAATGVIVCSVIGIAFGFYPALRAASLEPVEALRFE